MSKQWVLRVFGVISMGLLAISSNAQSTSGLSPEMFGGKGDAVVINSGNVSKNSTKLGCTGGKFTASDINKVIFVNGAGITGGTFASTIDSVFSADSIAMKYPAYLSASGAIVTYGTDCTDAFIKINAAAREIKDKTVRITFEKGTYLTKFNNWLAGIKNVLINGNGASIMCTNGAYNENGFPAANVTLYMPTVYDNVDNNYYDSKWAAHTSYGYRINSAAAADNKITLRETDSAANFKAGDWALIYGFDEQNVGGFPPNSRYFEFIKIKKVNVGGGGVITFNTPLKNSYDSGWPDSTWTGGTTGIGAPRIINCNRASFNIIDNLTINDLNFVPFPGWTGKYATPIRNGRFQMYGAINASFTNVHATGLYIGTSKNVNFKRSGFVEIEPDKEVDNLVFDDCPIHKLVGACGIDTIRLLRSNVEGEFAVSPRVLEMDGCNFSTFAQGSSSSLLHMGFNCGTDSVVLGNNTWNCNDAKRKHLFGPGASPT